MKVLAVSVALAALLLGANAADPVPSRTGNKVIFINENKKPAFAGEFNLAKNFSDGLAAVNIDATTDGKERGKWGYIDTTGKLVIDARFDEAGDFQKDRAFVAKLSGDKTLWGMIDKSGKELIALAHTDIAKFDFNGKLIIVRKGDKYAVYDRLGKERVPFKFNKLMLSTTDEGLIIVRDGAKYGLYAAGGSKIVAPKYDALSDFTHNKNMWASVQKDGKYGMINKSGKEVIKTKFDEELKFDEYGLAPTAIDGKKVMINMSGKVVGEHVK